MRDTRFPAATGSPALTVLMPVFNTAEYVGEAIESILAQTYPNFRFLIIDDASSDGSGEVIRSFQDPRIELITLTSSEGMAKALNRGLDRLTTPLVARMDSDDVSLPQRLERQIAFMERNPAIGISGTHAVIFNGKPKRVVRHPGKLAEIKAKLLFECALGHPTVIMRTELLNRHQLRYDEQMGLSEDWDLWVRAAECFDLSNLQEVLLRYRLHDSSLSARNIEAQKDVDRSMHAQFLRPIGLNGHPLQWVHSDVAMSTLNVKNRNEAFLSQVERWFEVLRDANRKTLVYDSEALSRFLKQRLLLVLQLNVRNRKRALRLFCEERLLLHCRLTDSLAFLGKCVARFR